ncbi:MAG TPA: amidohydrolase family protein [Candidatus Angelobacter sp.]|jgi:predicted TIM-barrel fold metal-dependent hydrolase|nr:amidohydrolase family protein [Candidatus Angelobacter sp.]
MSDQELKEYIVDCHCHIASEEHTPFSFIEGSIANMVASLSAQGIPVTARKLINIFLNKMQDPQGDALVAEMDEAGISKSVLLIPDFTFAIKDCKLTIEESFNRHREILLRHPGKFEVFGGVDPRWGKDGLALFERSLLEFGFRGMKIYPPCGYSPSDPLLFPYYELCNFHRVPVLLHIGPTSPVLHFSISSPFLLDEAARLFPNVNFILAHGAVSFIEECIMMCRYRPNVYLDISGYQATLGYDPAATAVRNVVSVGINHKVLFGTDFPVFRLQGDQKTFVDAVMGDNGPLAELNDRERALVLHRNIERLLESSVAVAA